jgi:hypothetical protein
MDPITVTHLVQDRTQDLQRIADQVRQERSLRSTPPAEVTASPARTAEARGATPPAPTKTGGCVPAEPAL